MTPPRPVLYLYSNKNIAGCALALGALAAFFGGAIHDFWPEIVAGAYAIGALGVPGQPRIDSDLEESMDPAHVQNALDRYVQRVRKDLPPDVFALVQTIATSIDGILPMLASSHALADQDSFAIRQTALHYLPETIAGYLALPPAFRNLQPMQDGKTAKQLLVEQLGILDGKMREIAQNLVNNNGQALIVNGAFLREKFAAPGFLKPV